MVESQVKLQFNPINGDLWFNFHVEKLSAEQLLEGKTLVGEYWWADNDELAFLTVYRNGEFMCERRKKAWSHRTGTYSFTAYKWTEPTEAQVAELADKLMKKFEELRIVRLQAEADRISGILSEEYNGLISSFRGMRTRMLVDSDWTQLADSPLSDADKALYATYRQHLRDMTDDPAWLANDVFNVDFPITPKVYLQKDPNRETEYLSVDAHFENQAAMKAKFKMMRVYKYLNLPGLFMSEEELRRVMMNSRQNSIDIWQKSTLILSLTSRSNLRMLTDLQIMMKSQDERQIQQSTKLTILLNN